MTTIRPSLFVFLILGCLNGATARSIANQVNCDDEKTGFFVTDNAILKSQDSIVYKDTSEEDCLLTCSNNRDQFGRSIICASFSYDHSQLACTIYKEKSVPAGEAEIEKAIGKRFFEKICLPKSVPANCGDSQFIRVDQSVLVGYASNLTLVDSIEMCVAQCVQETNCLSAMYFYEDGECITNKESALSKPTSFSKEENDRVVYFQNGCDLRKKVATDEVKSSESSGNVEEINGENGEEAVEEGGEEEGDEEVIDEVAAAEEVVTQISETTPKADFEETAAIQKEETAETKEEVEGNANEEEEYEEEEETDEETAEEEEETTPTPTTTTTTTTTAKPKKVAKYALQKKIKKHPKNFASKTYKALKKQNIHKSKPVENESQDFSDLEFVQPQQKMTRKSLRINKVKQVQETEENSEIEESLENLYFSEWSDWTPCTKSQERQIRRRKCLNLRRCLGALMQVQNCPMVVPTTASPSIESIRSVVTVDGDEYDDPNVPINKFFSPADSLPLLEDNVWGPWQGTCQHFASSQPCNNGNMIGFESRECVAKDPTKCEGPFFRYCTLSC